MDENEIKSLIGLKVKSLRTSMNLTQEEFGEIIGLEPANLSNLENGKAYPDIKTLINLISNTDMTPDYILGFLKDGEGEKYTSVDFDILSLLINKPVQTKEFFRDFLKSLK